MFFSEKSYSPRPDLRSCVSIVASAANVQQFPRSPWSLTGVIQPLLAEFQYAGSVSGVERKSGARRADASARTRIPFPGALGRIPGTNGGGSPAKTASAAKTTMNGSICLTLLWQCLSTTLFFNLALSFSPRDIL